METGEEATEPAILQSAKTSKEEFVTTSRELPQRFTGLLQEAIATYREIWWVAVPFVLQQILQTLYTLVDLWWLGRLSTEAVAAVTAASSLFFFILAFVIGVAISASVSVGRAHGAALEGAHKAGIVWGKIALGFMVGLGAAALGIIAAPRAFALLGLPPFSLLQSLALEYFLIVMGGVPLLAVTVVAMSSLQAMGKQWYGPIANAFGLVLNVILDPLFLFWFLWGVKGVAVATILAQVPVSLFLLGAIWRTVGQPPRQQFLSFAVRDVVRSYLSVGLTTTGETLARAVSSFLFVALVAPFGAVALAAYGAGNQIYSTAILFFLGVAFAVGTLSAREVGAGDLRKVGRLVRWGAALNALLLFVVGVVVWYGAPLLAHQFLPSDVEAQKQATTMIRWVFGGLWLAGITLVYIGALRALGYGVAALVVSLAYLIVQFGVAWFGSHWWGVEGIWAAYPASFVVGALLAPPVFWWALARERMASRRGER
ncbi:MAG: MATE family efflux transporter [Candidatus Parcubacteria bacterium]|nr:MAG: MATE family efflux transporter [Candidatus Parcubacteria bacterium]